MSAYLALTDGSTTSSSETLAANSGWTRLEVTYTNNTSASQRVRARLMTTTAGTAYMDCVQVEKAPTASRYNLIENGDFRYAGGWSSSTGRVSLSKAAPELDATVYKMTGDPLQNICHHFPCHRHRIGAAAGIQQNILQDLFLFLP